MMYKNTALAGLLFYLLLAGPLHILHAQPEETWLGADGGYLFQRIVPVDLGLPVQQQGDGLSLGLSLYFDRTRSYHKARVAVDRNVQLQLLPADVSSTVDRSISLHIDYEYTHFYFRNIADLHIDAGAGPYFFVQNQITDFQPLNNRQIEYNALHYGGGVDLVLRYNPPHSPVKARLNVVNGGFLGNKETNLGNDTQRSNRENGWFSKVNLRVAYQFHSDWEIYALGGWDERLEYATPQTQRRTFWDMAMGISFRLEDE